MCFRRVPQGVERPKTRIPTALVSRSLEHKNRETASPRGAAIDRDTHNRDREPTGRGVPRPAARTPNGKPYLMSLMMLNIGRYKAMTAIPTMPPITKIMAGSMIEVSESTVAVTSSS